MTPFLPGYEPGTWVEIVSAPEMLRALQYDYGTTFTLTDSLPYEPILGKSGLLRLYFPHSDSYHIIPSSMISRTIPAPYLSFDSLIANL